VKIQLCIVLALAPIILGGCQAKPSGQACADVLAHPPFTQINPAKDLPMMAVTPETTQTFADFNTLDPLATTKACGDPRCARLMSVSLVADKVTKKTTSVLVLCKSPNDQTVPLSYTPDELTAAH
jgi:hypothetical protein